MLKETDLSLAEIQERFPKVNKSMICLINTGKNWIDPEAIYPLRKFVRKSGEKAFNSLFTNEEVMAMRTRYSQGESSGEIVKSYPNISPNTIRAILYGRSYKMLPYWNRTKGQWIEPCIDYSQSLK